MKSARWLAQACLVLGVLLLAAVLLLGREAVLGAVGAVSVGVAGVMWRGRKWRRYL